MTEGYTHGDFDKALAAQRQYMEELLAVRPSAELMAMKPASGATQ